MDDLYKWEPHQLEFFPPDFRFKWPKGDEKLAGEINTVVDLDTFVMPHVKSRRVVVQAGGAVGVWPKRLAQLFETVYTFEPTPQSFHCLVCNVPEENVVKIQAALGKQRRLVTMVSPEPRQFDNYGANVVKKGGVIPMLRIDDLNLPVCDLLFLDLEGFERFAVEGGAETIERCRPVIVMEDKTPCVARLGFQQGDVVDYLAKRHGYREAFRFHGRRDVLCLP